MASTSQERKKAKEMQKQINKLQKELGEEIITIFKEAQKPLDVEEIAALYPDNERKKSANEKELKMYIQMGLGPLVNDGILVQLPVSEDGRYRLELRED